jgi:hypothetical protein
MKDFKQFREQVAAKSFLVIAEKEMTQAQMKKREDIAQSMSDEEFKKRYGKDWMSVKMATATKQAMKEEQEEEVYIDHWCAKHVYHDVFGEGVVVEGEHASPDEEGKIDWYTVEFPHGKETVYTEDVEIMHERMHGHMMKKKKKMANEVNEAKGKKHNCAKKVEHAMYGVGECISEQHAEPDQNGNISWYTVEFKDSVRKVFTENLKVLVSEVHGHMMGYGSYGGGEGNPQPRTESLVGNQHKIDMNKNNKIDAQDFEMLKKIKKARAK